MINNMDDESWRALERQNPWWSGRRFETGIDRLPWHPGLVRYMDAPEVLVLTGARRTGKSTLLHQLVRRLLDSGTPPEAVLFMNLEEPLLQSRSKEPGYLAGLVDQYRARHEGQGTQYLFLDEVQGCGHWAPAVKALHDAGGVKVVLTGSTSALLRHEAGRMLAGRCLDVEVRPLSFVEYLAFHGAGRTTTVERAHHFDGYLEHGAFPRVVLETDRELKHKLLRGYYRTIYLRDIIYPNDLRHNRDVADLLYFVISNVGKPFSYHHIARALGTSPRTVKEYLECAEDSYLIHTLGMYDRSVRRQIANPRKMYCLDTGLVNALSFRFSEDKGRVLENLVCSELRRRHGELFYHKANRECDFLVKEGLDITGAIQVALTIADEATRKREVRGLVEAMEAHDLDEGLILTGREDGEMTVGGRRVVVRPVHEWLYRIEGPVPA